MKKYEVRRSLDNAWLEIKDSKSNMAKANEGIAIMKAEISSLKDQLKLEREKNVKLEQYTRREILRLLSVQETEEENTEQLFTDTNENGVRSAKCELSRHSQSWSNQRSSQVSSP